MESHLVQARWLLEVVGFKANETLINMVDCVDQD